MQCYQIVSYYQEHIHDKHLDDDPDVVANLYSMHHLNLIHTCLLFPPAEGYMSCFYLLYSDVPD